MPEPFLNLLHQALATESRSTVMKSLGWLIAITLAAAISSFHFAAPLWFANTLGVLSLASILLYILAYIYFALTDKDALRSERFSIQKMAIQHGIVGDDIHGYVQTKDLPSPLAIESTATTEARTETGQ